MPTSKLTAEELTELGNHILDSQNPAVVAALAIGDDVKITQEYNKALIPDRFVWPTAANGTAIYESMDQTKFDALSDGKRDSWTLFINRADIRMADFRRQRVRKVCTDVWGNTDGSTVLNSLRLKATVFETVFPITDTTSGTATAGEMDIVGPASLDDISDALNLVGRP